MKFNHEVVLTVICNKYIYSEESQYSPFIYIYINISVKRRMHMLPKLYCLISTQPAFAQFNW